MFACLVVVMALDMDSGINAELEYFTDSDFFAVDTVRRSQLTYVGVIKVKT